MKKGDRVRVLDEYSEHYLAEGTIEYEDLPLYRVWFPCDNLSGLFYPAELEVINEGR
jgi:hypothetical protein